MKKTIIAIMLLFTAGCGASATPGVPPTPILPFTAPTPDPHPAYNLTGELKPGEMAYVRLHSSTPEANPVMILRVTITDKETGEAVDGLVTLGDRTSEQMGYHIDMILEPHMDEILRVEAPGYEPSEMRLMYNIKSSRVMTYPVQLAPLKDSF